MKTLHLVVTTLCNRNCKFCCNNQYNIANLEYATDDDFKWCEMLCLTGGEPFTYTNPVNLAARYKALYPNIKSVVVYANAVELGNYILLANYIIRHSAVSYDIFDNIDGINVSIKNAADLDMFNNIIMHTPSFLKKEKNRVYDFLSTCEVKQSQYYSLIKRKWQENFVPAEECRFKRGN